MKSAGWKGKFKVLVRDWMKSWNRCWSVCSLRKRSGYKFGNHWEFSCVWSHYTEFTLGNSEAENKYWHLEAGDRKIAWRAVTRRVQRTRECGIREAVKRGQQCQMLCEGEAWGRFGKRKTAVWCLWHKWRDGKQRAQEWRVRTASLDNSWKNSAVSRGMGCLGLCEGTYLRS